MARDATGGPESPPAPAAATMAWSVRNPSRDSVVLVAMMPANFRRTTRLAILRTSSSLRSGAIFTRTGTPSAAARTASSKGSSLSSSWSPRSPGVFGELTFTAR